MTIQDRRRRIADEIIRRVDTVTLLTVPEVESIYKRAAMGEFDDIFTSEKENH